MVPSRTSPRNSSGLATAGRTLTFQAPRAWPCEDALIARLTRSSLGGPPMRIWPCAGGSAWSVAPIQWSLADALRELPTRYSVKAHCVIQTAELRVYLLSTIGFCAWIRALYLSNEDPAAVGRRF